jgi:7-cyano-7-deazaguanine reductase
VRLTDIDRVYLETFENPRPDRLYTIEFTCSEFTSLCPKTGQPDFATIVVRYVPGPRCVELKSLKQYFWSFRDLGIFFESVTNQILDDLVEACEPIEMTVTGNFNVRGGIGHEITAEYESHSTQ